MKKYINTGNKDTRSGFGAGLSELGATNPKVVALCAYRFGKNGCICESTSEDLPMWHC